MCVPTRAYRLLSHGYGAAESPGEGDFAGMAGYRAGERGRGFNGRGGVEPELGEPLLDPLSQAAEDATWQDRVRGAAQLCGCLLCLSLCHVNSLSL